MTRLLPLIAAWLRSQPRRKRSRSIPANSEGRHCRLRTGLARLPFAAPPVGIALESTAACRQMGRHLSRRPLRPDVPSIRRGRTMNHYFGKEATSEDCLYLNVWAPPVRKQAACHRMDLRRCFNVGSASMANYSGEGLAEKGVVRVNLAYRVGPMGFLAHPELGKEMVAIPAITA